MSKHFMASPAKPKSNEGSTCPSCSASFQGKPPYCPSCAKPLSWGKGLKSYGA